MWWKAWAWHGSVPFLDPRVKSLYSLLNVDKEGAPKRNMYWGI